MFRGVRSLAIAGAVALVVVASAASADWASKDPPRTRLGTLPSSCTSAPFGKECIDAGVYYLDKARSKVGLPPYALPANFASLSEPQQWFILVNLDRVQYKLPPFRGLTTALNHDALASGVWAATDPHPSKTTGLTMWWPGWAGAFYNAPMAYEVVMWDDGLGSTNPRCTSTDHSRCWGHRHSVLWKFAAGARLAMGAAAGPPHHRGYAWIFVGGNSSYHPRYTYTWKKAVADGAGKNAYDPGPSPSSMCHVPIAVGMDLPGAKRAIKKGHCALGDVVQVHNDFVAGTVIQQHPAPQKTFAAGTSVRLTVSLGPS
jgi:hypothetical protein